MYNRIVLNEPHASLEGLYGANKSYWDMDASFLNDVIIKWTDWNTDYLFHGLQDKRVKTVRFPYSRFIVDAERLWNDPLEKIGQGIVYKSFDGYQRQVPAYSEQMLLNLWKWHQQQLQNNLRRDALLLDCHSFPEDLSDIDICIGFNEDWSKPEKETIEYAVNFFMDHGYRVGVNTPYSNSETPACPFQYHSLMLEVNKKTYLQPHSINLVDEGLRDVISMFMAGLFEVEKSSDSKGA
jgi:N-formylglutamate amidohydrolase